MKVLIVDDDRLVCTSLKIILEMDPDVEVLGIGNDGADAVTLYEEKKPDILLMDIRMKHMTGLEAAEKIFEKHKDAKILFLTTFSDNEYIIKALHMGARGYLLKQDYESIIPALRAVNMGQSVFGDEIISKLPDMIAKKPSVDYASFHINEKESEIIEKVADGLSNKEIAEEMYLSEGTVRNYLSTILEKLNLRDRTQLAIFYYKNR
ncbi:MAG: response regulator transcription factor [Lachnospiraceae bacterium]|nr:response regulator transcription factor [Lachnospiraceae bacterium]